MADKLVTIRVPGDALGLKYVFKGEDGYMLDRDLTFDRYEQVQDAPEEGETEYE